MISELTFYDVDKPIGCVSMVNGVVVFSDEDLEKRLRSRTIVEPDTFVPITPEDGERYMNALAKSFRPPYFFCRISRAVD